MAQVAQGKKDIVFTKKQDEGDFVAAIPPALENKPVEELRLNSSGAIVDATTLTTFFVDDNGVKHASNHATDELEVTGTFALNRRANPNVDRIERTTGSFIADGFTAPSFVSVEGSSGNDKPFKITAVNVLNMEIDEDFGRISPDEAAQTLTLYQGWQRIEGLAWTGRLRTDANGKWEVIPDATLKRQAELAFLSELASFVDAETQREINEDAPGVTLLRSERRQQSAMADLLTPASAPTWDDLQDDLNVAARQIYNELSASSSSVSVTFNATANRIERTAGSWITDGFVEGMEVTVTGSSNNNAVWTVHNATALNLAIIDEESLTQEGPVSVDVSGLKTLAGYRKWRSSTDEWSADKADLGRYMKDSVITEWFERVGKAENTYGNVVENATVWAGSTVYAVDDAVYDPITNLFYVCNTGHTSGTTFASDIANWGQYLPTQFSIDAFPRSQLELD